MGWVGFLNKFRTTFREDLGVEMMEDEWEKAQKKTFPHQVLQCALKSPSIMINLLTPATMGCVAWLGSVQKQRFKNLQHPKKNLTL